MTADATWLPPQRDWRLSEIAVVLGVSDSTLKKHAKANNGVLVTGANGEALLVAKDLLGRVGGPGEQRWAVPHADVVRLLGDVERPIRTTKPTKGLPTVTNNNNTGHPASKPRADLSWGPIKCEIRTSGPLSPGQWVIVGALAEEVREAAEALLSPVIERHRHA